MVLAHFGKQVSEEELVDAVEMEEGGVDIVELARLAQSQGLSAEIQQPDISGLAQVLADDKLAIVYLNRLPLDREFAIHAVLPIRVTSRFVVILDPRKGERRISHKKFEKARGYLDRYCVVCNPLAERTR